MTAPPPEDVPYMPMAIPTELEPYKGGILEEEPVSWWWLALPVGALFLFSAKR